MNSLFDGTSRLAQMALCVIVGAIVMTTFSAVTYGSAKLGPIVMLVAGAMSLVAYIRDREDHGMWPAYVTFGAVVVGFTVSIPLMMNSGGMRAIARDGEQARAELSHTRNALQFAAKQCVIDGPIGNCTAHSISQVPVASQAGVRPQRGCKETGVTCVSDEAGGGYRVEFVTRNVEKVGPVVVEEIRSRQHQTISVTCRATRANADLKQVTAACGPGIVVKPANGS